MVNKTNDIKNCRFGRLVAIESTDLVLTSTSTWICVCDCGKKHQVKAGNLKSGNTKSCGCLVKEIGRRRLTGQKLTLKHGQRNSPEYASWNAMKNRCNNPKSDSYRHYGGRGIRVCERWLNSFECFLEDMGKRPTTKHTLERKDNNGHYEPNNCRWATLEEQSNNKRNNVYYDYRGERLTVPEIARRVGILPTTLETRIRRGGMSLELAVSKSINRNLISYKGTTRTLGAWAKIYGLNYITLKRRLDRGVPFE